MSEETQGEIRNKFNAMKQFVHEMASFFQKDMGLKLYDHLLAKTTLSNVAPVQKHITIFTEFCKKNRSHILTQNSALPTPRIHYSDRVFINFEKLFKEIENEPEAVQTQEVLFDHFLVLSVIFDPESGAGAELKSRKKKAENNASSDLDDLFANNTFLASMMGKVEKQIKPGSNPMTAMTDMMQSGLLEELVGGMQENIQNGNLDITELMGTVNKMTQSLPQDQLQALQPMLGLAMNNGNKTRNITKQSQPSLRGGKKKRKNKK
jgi:hypothetical protein